ncbi:Protein argonaute-2 [Stylosanthes scabra]|uniref:Protein argonaute-2 n=1 Tax=Stylosanthes scabra TaxID=79078 RepID=A0ABU6XB92_9FABA|nr:Protein argonaute-2 [Stylosanthes scabra]
METGGDDGRGHGVRGPPPRQQQPPELNLQPQWRRPQTPPTTSHSNLTLQPEWRRSRQPPSTSTPSHPQYSSASGEEPRELRLQPEWRRPRPPTTTTTTTSQEPERRLPRPTSSFWNQNQSYRKLQSSSSGSESSRTSSAADHADFWRLPSDSQVPKLERLQISRQLATASSTVERKDKLSPIRRPDNGGTLAILTSKLRVNHFPVKLNPESIIMYYNVGVKPKFPSKHGRPQKLSKSDLSMIRDKLFSNDPQRLPLDMTAYDGAKNIFSAIKLPEETFTVELSEGDDEKTLAYSASQANGLS